jgi:quinol monooxygenase YgiN
LVIIFIKIMVRPETRKELSQTLHSIIAQVSKESGCLHAAFYQDAENNHSLLMVEEWATQKDVDDHMRSDIFTVLIGAGSLMHRPPEIVIHVVDRSPALEHRAPTSITKYRKEPK